MNRAYPLCRCGLRYPSRRPSPRVHLGAGDAGRPSVRERPPGTGRGVPVTDVKRPLVDGIARALRWLYPAGRRGAAARPCGGTDEIRLFRDLRARDGGPPGLDARTESDLDLDAVFERVDVWPSAVGQQWLWARLRTPVADAAALAAFDSLASCLAGCERARDELRKSLSRLSGPGAYLLPFLLYGELPARPPSRRVVPVLTLAAAAAVGASLWLGVPGVLALVAICAANVVVRLSCRRELAPALGSLPAVRALLRAGVELGRAGSTVPEPARSRIAAATAPLRGLLRTTG